MRKGILGRKFPRAGVQPFPYPTRALSQDLTSSGAMGKGWAGIARANGTESGRIAKGPASRFDLDMAPNPVVG